MNVNLVGGLYVSGGIIPSTLIDAKYRQEITDLTDGNSTLLGGDQRNLKTFQLSSTFGIDYIMKLTEQWSTYTEPSFSYCFTAQQSNQPFDRSPWRVGANIGFVFRF